MTNLTSGSHGRKTLSLKKIEEDKWILEIRDSSTSGYKTKLKNSYMILDSFYLDHLIKNINKKEYLSEKY